MRNNNDIKVIGLTGGTGTGKSTVASILTEYGGIVIDADKIYKELIKKDNVVYRELINYFGNEIVGRNGEIDRGKLSDIVFNDKDKLNMLNRLTHKHVGDEIHRQVEQIKKDLSKQDQEKPSFIVLDVPIPVEYGFFDLADIIFAVVANDDIRVERIIDRNGLTEQEAELRIYSQMSNREYINIADVVIENEGDLEVLRKNVVNSLAIYLS